MTLRRTNTKRQQIKDVIVRDIESGGLRPGTRLLPVNALAKQFNISVSVAYHALNELVEERYVESRGSMGFYVLRNTPEKETKTEPASKARSRGPRKVFLSGRHHSDLVWQYTYDRYRAIREKQFETLERLLENHPEFHCYVEQSEVLSVYLKDHPEKLDFYRRVHREGRFTPTGGGTIPDTNLVTGEVLVRILRAGRDFYREVFGEEVVVDNRNDTFGLSPQLPQIVLKSGYRYLVVERMGNCPPELERACFVWRGLDGSRLTVAGRTHGIDHMAVTCNAPYVRTEDERLWECLLRVRHSEHAGDILASYGAELASLKASFPLLVQRANAEPGTALLEFGSVREFCERLDPETLPCANGEFNPLFTGCYTTRIGVKQSFRRAENGLFAAEMLAAGLDLDADFAAAWHGMLETAFHDAICGCHHDPANADVMARLDAVHADLAAFRRRAAAEFSGFTVFHPGQYAGSGVVEWEAAADAPLPEDVPLQRDGASWVALADLPACGWKRLPTAPGRKAGAVAEAPARFETKHFEVDFSEPHPVIRDRHGVLSGAGFGEILFRHDAGSMWSERFGGHIHGRRFQEERVVSRRVGDVFFRVETEGAVVGRLDAEGPNSFGDGSAAAFWHGFESLRFRKIYRFYRELDYFTLKILLDWRGENTKIQVRFPLNLDVGMATGMYGVPFAGVARAPYYEVRSPYRETLREIQPRAYADAGGDWPALHWVDYADTRKGCAVANNGTPAHQCANGEILVALLRSGTMILDGFMRPQPGALDNGLHEYDFAIRPHAAADAAAPVRLAEILNRQPLVFPGTGRAGARPEGGSWLRVTPDNVVVSSLRRAEGGWIARLYETLGRGCRAEIEAPAALGAWSEADLREKDWQPVEGPVLFAPFEIKTLKFEPRRP